MTCNLQLEDAIQIVEDLLNSSKSSMVMETIKNIKNPISSEKNTLD